MTERDLQVWWSSLPISEKERIARKGSGDETQAQYPACTAWWNNLDMERQKKIYQHCVARHGDELREWKEGNPYGD
jgi:hypothetical protein